MRYLLLTLCLLFLAPSSFAQIFGYDTVGGTFITISDYQVILLPDRLSPPQGGAIRIDSVLVYARSAISAVKGYAKGVVYNYNPVTAECSLQVVSADSVLIDSETAQWWNVPMPQDTIRACREYMVGIQVKNHSGAAELRLFIDAVTGDDLTWFIGDSDFDPPITLSGATVDNDKNYSLKAYYTVVSTDTLIIVDLSSADSASWNDTRLVSDSADDNFITSDEFSFGKKTSPDHNYSFLEYTNMSNVIPSGKKCDTAYFAMTTIAFGGSTRLDSIFPDLRRIIRNWAATNVTYNKYTLFDSWTAAGANSEGNDIVSYSEELDSVCRCRDQVGWKSFFDTTMCGVDDTLLLWVNPNTIDSMSSGDWTNNGWKVQYDADSTGDLQGRYYSRDRSPFSDRPYMYIYASDEPSTAVGQIIMIGSSP